MLHIAVEGTPNTVVQCGCGARFRFDSASIRASLYPKLPKERVAAARSQMAIMAAGIFHDCEAEQAAADGGS